MNDILEVLFTIVIAFFWLFGGHFFKNRDDSTSDRPDRSRRDKKQEDEPILTNFDQRQQKTNPAPATAEERVPQPKVQPVRSPEPQNEVIDEPFVTIEPVFQATHDTAFEQEMQQRLQAIEATKRKAEALKKQAAQVAPDHYGADPRENAEPKSGILLGPVRSELKNPRAARAAFIYGEVLGEPVGLRNAAQRRY